MKLNLSSNFANVAEAFRKSAKQVNFACAVALTKTVKDDIQPALRDEMRQAFDRPTPYTLNSTYVRPATPSRLEATIGIKDNTFGKGNAAIKFLAPEIFGGVRNQKGYERLLQRIGVLPAGWHTVPGAGAQLDSYGNMSRGQINQILSYLQAFRESGYKSNSTKATRAKLKQGTKTKRGIEYFVSNGRGSTVKYGEYNYRTGKTGYKKQHLPAGVWMKTSFAFGKAIKPVLLFVKDTHYSKRFKFYEVGNKVAEQKLPINLEAALEEAFRTAIPTDQRDLFT